MSAPATLATCRQPKSERLTGSNFATLHANNTHPSTRLPMSRVVCGPRGGDLQRQHKGNRLARLAVDGPPASALPAPECNAPVTGHEKAPDGWAIGGEVLLGAPLGRWWVLTWC